MKKTAPYDQLIGAPDRLRLFDVASGQAGYFTTEQARGCGYSRGLLSYHAKTGRFIRVGHGLYRLREYPSSAREHVLAAWLAVGKDVATVSHESALDLLELSDVIPDAVHLTVPRSRRSLPSTWGVRIHTTARPIGPGERWVREGIAITSPTRSILDAAEAGADPDQIERAVVQAVARGLATSEALRRAARERSRRVAWLIEGALQKVPARVPT
jgi:predicted transcriptional regulator of viral defense system